MSSAEGSDYSAFQPPLTQANLAGLTFAFVKATNGLSEIDPHFAGNWATVQAAGIHRGAYHEFEPRPSAGEQARYFLAAVTAQGLKPGDMLAVVVSDYTTPTAAEVNAFCEACRAAAPHSPVLIYSDLSVAAFLGGCTSWPLWIAWYDHEAPASVAPWPRWTFWQWTDEPLDRDAFNGTPADLDAWIASYLPKPQPAPHLAQEGSMILGRKGTPTPIALGGTDVAIRFCPVGGNEGEWDKVELLIDWHNGSPAEKQPVSWNQLLPVMDRPDRVYGVVVWREDDGRYDVAYRVLTAADVAAEAAADEAAREALEAA